ncbi:hypothetical protein SDC9_188727 [bioreactor metagenome]|uniref:Uncharacterized protein n=1 Tax=bioreactor metagenome TaxID=1076179 RepID=A0A645HQ53_9ZZZZ
MPDRVLIAEPAIQIRADRDSALIALPDRFPEEVEAFRKGRMPDADLGVVIAEPLIAFRVEADQIDAHASDVFRELIRVVVVSDIRTGLHRVIVEKQNIFRLVHFSLFIFPRSIYSWRQSFHFLFRG